MKLDANKTNGSSPPSGFVNQGQQHTNNQIPSSFLSAQNEANVADQILTIDELGAWLKMTPQQIYELTRRRGPIALQVSSSDFTISSKGDEIPQN